MEKFTQSNKISFVLRNVSILIHLKDLMSFKRAWRDSGYDVKILGIALSGSPISIDNVVKMFRLS